MCIRDRDIVVDQCRTMGNLNEDIFSYACDSVIPCLEVIRKSIVMEEISCNAVSYTHLRQRTGRDMVDREDCRVE